MNFIISQVGNHHHPNTGRHNPGDKRGKQLVAILAMFLVIGYLVWTMG